MAVFLYYHRHRADKDAVEIEVVTHGRFAASFEAGASSSSSSPAASSSWTSSRATDHPQERRLTSDS
jgi:hypothetical protein